MGSKDKDKKGKYVDEKGKKLKDKCCEKYIRKGKHCKDCPLAVECILPDK
ncbi:MAG: hypothetical protein KJ950_10520 [Proteobacteria bacterium]|nr:hypothetical protein [Pseudomonadota bacterium]MBU1687503.1 hypothetical protein [Pseudomonadota bacterium]